MHARKRKIPIIFCILVTGLIAGSFLLPDVLTIAGSMHPTPHRSAVISASPCSCSSLPAYHPLALLEVDENCTCGAHCPCILTGRKVEPSSFVVLLFHMIESFLPSDTSRSFETYSLCGSMRPGEHLMTLPIIVFSIDHPPPSC